MKITLNVLKKFWVAPIIFLLVQTISMAAMQKVELVEVRADSVDDKGVVYTLQAEVDTSTQSILKVNYFDNVDYSLTIEPKDLEGKGVVLRSAFLGAVDVVTLRSGKDFNTSRGGDLSLKILRDYYAGDRSRGMVLKLESEDKETKSGQKEKGWKLYWVDSNAGRKVEFKKLALGVLRKCDRDEKGTSISPYYEWVAKTNLFGNEVIDEKTGKTVMIKKACDEKGIKLISLMDASGAVIESVNTADLPKISTQH
jgi:hypothetical protein